MKILLFKGLQEQTELVPVTVDIKQGSTLVCYSETDFNNMRLT